MILQLQLVVHCMAGKWTNYVSHLVECFSLKLDHLIFEFAIIDHCGIDAQIFQFSNQTIIACVAKSLAAKSVSTEMGYIGRRTRWHLLRIGWIRDLNDPFEWKNLITKRRHGCPLHIP
jgi:hypothetical protein